MNALTQLPVSVERRDAVWLFRLCRPNQRNAIGPGTSRLMNEHMLAFERDPLARAGIIAAEGEGIFCAGADLKAIARGELEQIVGAEPFGFAGVVRGERGKP